MPAPKTKGAPGRFNWWTTTLLRISANDMTNPPAMVTGATAPICGPGEWTTGSSCSAINSSLSTAVSDC